MEPCPKFHRFCYEENIETTLNQHFLHSLNLYDSDLISNSRSRVNNFGLLSFSVKTADVRALVEGSLDRLRIGGPF